MPASVWLIASGWPLVGSQGWALQTTGTKAEFDVDVCSVLSRSGGPDRISRNRVEARPPRSCNVESNITLTGTVGVIKLLAQTER